MPKASDLGLKLRVLLRLGQAVHMPANLFGFNDLHLLKTSHLAPDCY
jgi:hypothetical protein